MYDQQCYINTGEYNNVLIYCKYLLDGLIISLLLRMNL